MTEKTFEVAGTSTLNGVTKVRFANDYVGRFKILAKNNHENIELIELGDKFSKAEICQILMQHEKFQSEEQQGAIAEFVVRNIKQELTKVEVTEDAVIAQVLRSTRAKCAPALRAKESGGAPSNHSKSNQSANTRSK